MLVRGLLVTAVLVGSTVAAGCGGGGSSAAPTSTSAAAPVTTAVTPTTVSVALAAQQYQAAADKTNSAMTAMVAKVGTLGDNPQSSALAAALQPAITALKQYDAALTGIAWPAVALSDAHAVIQAHAGHVGILESTAQQNIFSAASFEAQVAGAAAQVKAAVGLLRHDLGLPPAP